MPKLPFPKVELLLFALLLTVILAQAGCQTDRNPTTKKTQAKVAEKSPDLNTILQSLKPQETSELLLLGLYYHGEDTLIRANQFKNGYRTLLLRYQNGTVSLVNELPYLATPQPNGFYFVGEKKETWTAFDKEMFEELNELDKASTDFDDAYPVIKSSANVLTQELKKPGPPSDPIPDCEDCEGMGTPQFESTKTIFTYLIPGFASVNAWGDNYTGGAHGNRFDHNNTVNFATLVDSTTKPVQLPLNFSIAKWDTIKRTLYFKGIANLFIDGGYEEKRLKGPFKLNNFAKFKIGKAEGDYQIDPENRDYVLYHGNGLVQLAIRAHASADYVSSGDYELTTEYEAGPLQIPGLKNSLPFKFSDLVNTDSTIFDCFLSPKQNILVLTRKVYKAGKQAVDQNELAVLDVRTGKTLYRQTLPLNVVMAEWATGKSVDRWQQLLKP